MEKLESRRVRVRGTVQGVGFRPFVYKLAGRFALTGDVSNDGEGVIINAWGKPGALDQFVEALRNCDLPLAKVTDVEQDQLSQLSDLTAPACFRIDLSRSGAARTGVSPDACICSDCLSEICDPKNRRYRYAFTNCTHCGPRLSIIRSIPYDRSATSMSVFPLCESCRAEYDNPEDRRFHAQPNACASCGPYLSFVGFDGLERVRSEGIVDPLKTAAETIRSGKIVAVKGLGGFHLVCDALNEEAVSLLRLRKRRFDKPFALMALDLKSIEKFCEISADERAALSSAAAPIVLLRPRPEGSPLPAAIAPGQSCFGFMLPYTPLHFLLLQELLGPIVCTSGNLSDEPQCTTNEQAEERLAEIADFALLHNRDIVNRVDDSVLRFAGAKMRLLRRARGFAPDAQVLPPGFDLDSSILSMGGELKNTFCLLKDNRAIVSQHIGDLEDARTYADYRKNLDLYKKLFLFEEDFIVVDMHRDYISTKLGKNLAFEKGTGLIEVQHHHAHIAACMGEHGIGLTAAPVLGVAMDGLGMGADGQIWGAEFLLADYSGFKRLGSLRPAPLIGGVQAMKEPWRNLYAQICQSMGFPEFCREFGDLELCSFFKTKPLSIFDGMLSSGTNVAPASSAGRLFDAVAAALGICRERASYEGQAAIELETLAQRTLADCGGDNAYYSFQIQAGISEQDEVLLLEPSSMWRQLFADMTKGMQAGLIALRFHEGLARAVVELCGRLRDSDETNKIDTIALSGGVFQNKLFLESVSLCLEKRGYRVISPGIFPANDGGISFGQALICAARLLKGEVPQNVSGNSRKNC